MKGKNKDDLKKWRLKHLSRIPDEDWEKTLEQLGVGKVSINIRPNRPLLIPNRSKEQKSRKEE